MGYFYHGSWKKDQPLLELVKSYFGVGAIYDSHSANVSQFRVQSVEDLAVILNHFDKYPLVTQKKEDYMLFRRVFGLIEFKDHLTEEGFLTLLA